MTKRNNNTQLINTSEELNNIWAEMDMMDYDGEADAFLIDNSYYNTIEDDLSLESAFDMFNELRSQNKTLYELENCCYVYYFAGDLKKDILPMFKAELKRMQKQNEEKEREWEAQLEYQLEDDLKCAKLRVKELESQVANKKGKRK